MQEPVGDLSTLILLMGISHWATSLGLVRCWCKLTTDHTSIMNTNHSNRCDDSTLSMVGNTAGILTFTLGLLASYVALMSIMRGAIEEAESLERSTCSIRMQLIPLLEYCAAQQDLNSRYPTQLFGSAKDEHLYRGTMIELVYLEESINDLRDSIDALGDELDKLSMLFLWSRTISTSLLRLLWPLKRSYFIENFSQLSRKHSSISDHQSALILRLTLTLLS